ncbi:cytochrome P450 4p1-like [Drosophila miranda]|uniref:cytochrome P450 4p1-like n=1 Tax=Drosophila miranda TaxID=7229 RepID=UPI0007E81648|nr:cytochrome P450 4p1-like [Drosophila miranda]
MITLWLTVALCVVIHWLYQVNKDYYILAFFSRRVYTRDDRPVESLVPSPKGRTIFAHCFDLYGKDNAGVFKFTRDLSKTLGKSYVRYVVGMPIYNVIDAESAEMILTDQKSLIGKGCVYNFLHPALKTGLLTSKGDKWHARRRMLTPTFHFNILGQFQEIFQAESLKFVQQFQSQDENIVSLSELIPRFTLNTICETAMGVKLDEMADKGDRYRESFHMIEKSFVRRLSNPFLRNTTIYNLFVAKEYAPFLKVVHDFSSEIIAKRRILLEEELEHRRSTQTADDDIFVSRHKRFAMLDTLICAEKDGLIDHAGICEEVDTLMFEGYDVSSITLIFTLMNMSLYPDKQELCFNEIQEHIEDDFSNLDINQMSKLKYLEYFIKETMRLFPPIPLMGRQAVQETELANGLILPSGTQIHIHTFDIHRNPKHWDSPNEFRPERFLPENSQNRPVYAYIPFSAGQRNCIAQKFAMQEMKTLMTVILKKFEIQPLVDPKSIIFHVGITLRIKNHIRVKLVRRK